MFNHIVGQEHIKERLRILIEYSKKIDSRLPDLFFAGPGGVGKSTFARSITQHLGWIAKDNPAFAEINATSAKNMADLLTYMHGNCRIPIKHNGNNTAVIIPRCVIFIDEVHKLREPLRTELLNAMDDKRTTTFKIPTGQVMSACFDKVTFIMATTDKNDLSDAFLSRFQLFELIPYNKEEIATAVSYKTNWPLEACLEIGKRAKTVMRVAMLDIDAIKAFLEVKQLEPTAENISKYYTDIKKVDDLGLDDVDYKILHMLAESNAPLGLGAIASRLRKPSKEVENREGFLAAEGFIEKVPGGRTISIKGNSRLKSTG